MKDPKEYAKELVEKYFDAQRYFPTEIDYSWSFAIKCALIAVDEKIETCNKFYTQLSFPAEVKSDSGYICFKMELQYLEQVKTEIINLK